MKNCKRCNKSIPKARLEVLPNTVICVKCSAEIGGEYEFQIIQENCGSSIVSKPVIHRLTKAIVPKERDCDES
jgi:hypothetical protein